ncbi:MAG: hypothetical protein Q8P55_00045 [bacterium]|nr:hypothetical protein [bacterium]
MNNEKHYCRISVLGLTLALGLFWGVYLFVLALLAGWGIRFMWISKELVQILNSVYPGYTVGLTGAFIGLVEGFICGGIGGAIIAWLHNKFCGLNK